MSKHLEPIAPVPQNAGVVARHERAQELGKTHGQQLTDGSGQESGADAVAFLQRRNENPG